MVLSMLTIASASLIMSPVAINSGIGHTLSSRVRCAPPHAVLDLDSVVEDDLQVLTQLSLDAKDEQLDELLCELEETERALETALQSARESEVALQEARELLAQRESEITTLKHDATVAREEARRLELLRNFQMHHHNRLSQRAADEAKEEKFKGVVEKLQSLTSNAADAAADAMNDAVDAALAEQAGELAW